jgi:hypothetical protein
MTDDHNEGRFILGAAQSYHVNTKDMSQETCALNPSCAQERIPIQAQYQGRRSQKVCKPLWL